MSRIIQVLLGMLLVAQNSAALTSGAKVLTHHETKSNAAAVRSNEMVKIPHYNIPLDMLEVDFADRLSEDFRKHLIFERHGVKYVRWILNPEDTKWHEQLKVHFFFKGLDLEKKYYFKGYQTASRSYIVEDPQQQIQFSVKSSTNVTGGNWADKKQPVGEAIDSRLNADFLYEIQKVLRFEHVVILDEPAILKLPAIDQAVVFRQLGIINDPKSGMIYVPGFSVLHETTGARIAKINGSYDPYEFWTEHYVKAVARAMGEFAARTGMQFDSPHSQNFLVELDSGYKPTGRIVIRDLADFYIYKRMMKVLNKNSEDFFNKFTQKGNLKDYIPAGFGPLHGNRDPSWIATEQYAAWKDIYFEQFQKTFTDVSGLELDSYKANENKSTQSGKYYGNAYLLRNDDPAVGKFLENLARYKSPKGIYNCSYIFMVP